ncbi:MAG: hypothetical protein JXQ29_14335 [Planctomycetes bacterium]|nr:hypothetical protein [Planctomycetota bacterium]
MRIAIGALIWLGVLGGGGTALLALRDHPVLAPAQRLIRYLRTDPVTFTVTLPGAIEPAATTHALVRDPEHFLRRVGSVRHAERCAGQTRLEVEIFPEEAARLGSGVDATYFTVPGSAAWIVRTLVPRERLQQIRALWATYYAAEREEIVDTLWPVVKESLEEVLRFYEAELPRVLRAHREDLDALVARHDDGAFDRELMPAVRAVAWERVRVRFSPLLEEVGRELWDRLPVWGLGWRYAYEQLPFTRDDHVSTRFNEFLEEDALPLLAARTERVVRLLGEVLRDTASDSLVVEAMKHVAAEVAADPATAELARDLWFELVLRNDRLKALIRARWEVKGMKQAVASVADRLEPLIREVINAIVLSADGQTLSPRLAQVLRARVLKKDGAWLLLEPGEAGARGAPLARGAEIPGRVDAGD